MELLHRHDHILHHYEHLSMLHVGRLFVATTINTEIILPMTHAITFAVNNDSANGNNSNYQCGAMSLRPVLSKKQSFPRKRELNDAESVMVSFLPFFLSIMIIIWLTLFQNMTFFHAFFDQSGESFCHI
jgi:hypothetical protein